ncbi:MAG TPA: lipid-A-disaccharide synthase [Pyrinomonadaceae bacterium]
MKKTRQVMIVAGEPSGDAHAASLVHALREVDPDAAWTFTGATGPLMRAAGVHSVVTSDDLAIMGIMEVGRVFRKFWRAFKQLKHAALDNKPDAVILVDWPEFNLRLARALHKHNIKVIYYISPQLWAWRSYRKRSVQRDVDLVLSILPFEKAWYAQHGIDQVEFVGHPLAGEVEAAYGREEFCRLNDLDPSRSIVSLLPGSRLKELQRILPPMLDAVVVLAQLRSEVQFVLVVAPSRSVSEAESVLANHPAAIELPSKIRVVHHHTREALAASNVAAIASGTATLEAALLGTPMVIVYKESPINWHVLGRLINVVDYGLVNLIAGKRIVPELMQSELSGQSLADNLITLLDTDAGAAMRKQLEELARNLGEGNASQRAAETIVKALDSWTTS